MNILATIAQWERDIISERTRDAMQFMKRSLKLVGAVPYGFDNRSGHLVPNPDEMETIQKVVLWRQQGNSYRNIADRLNAQGITSKRGGRWHPKTVLGVVLHVQALPGEHWVMRKYFPKGVKINANKTPRGKGAHKGTHP